MRRVDEKADNYRDKRVRRSLISVSSFFQFLALSSFIVTCCLIMFLKISDATLHWELINVRYAAIYTFGNVLFFGLIFCVFDNIRNKITISRPINRILKGTSSIIKGDFSIRIKPIHKKRNKNEFDVLIEDFNKMAQELEGIETLRNDFISNVSHELKTPLAVIQNYATILQDPELDEEKKAEYIKSIFDASKRLSTLITNILKLNKLENQQIFPVSAEYDLSEQICQCLLDFESVWENKNINIVTDIDPDIRISADKELMTHVWNNLFSNAFKFTPDNGTVSVSLKQDSEIRFTVSDTGCGMNDSVKEHIYEKFYQGDSSHSVNGNGLGLPLVKRVLDIVGGKIEVESKAGEGSTFTVRCKRP